MNGNKAVLDRNVLIDASKGLINFDRIIKNFDFFSSIYYTNKISLNYYE
ncbi:MAG TPA: hypothetical protein PKY56_00275 [Candidatus Kapabacteria bacterium]|nr:hypothetical protein [Candidatus Kapabacteria bacterium]HPO61570.1 hypothetical protein [Candidatus Kapabacteria bacterium]